MLRGIPHKAGGILAKEEMDRAKGIRTIIQDDRYYPSL